MEASRHRVTSGTTLGYLSPKDMNQPSSSFFSMSPSSTSSATVARELLMNGTSPTAEAIGLKGSSPTPPCSPVQPSKQLEYLARIQGFQAQQSRRITTRSKAYCVHQRKAYCVHQRFTLRCLFRHCCFVVPFDFSHCFTLMSSTKM
ncbi:hypothetical protein STEG23_025709, partial [Scotinomys teguina]